VLIGNAAFTNMPTGSLIFIFLREKAQKEAYLIFLYFVCDSTHIPTSHETWDSALKLQKKLMGLSAGSLRGKVIDLFINTNEIKTI